jgi:allantoinase
MHREWMIRSRRVVLPDGVRPASIKVRNGIIDGIGSFQCSPSEDAGDWVIMPGLVDTHVHINEPGRTEWEGFSTATRAAAAGGQLLLRLSAETGCAVHVVHLSSAEALEFLRAARSRRLPVTVETCPHYLAFRAEEIPDGATEFKCAPPIREANNCEALWEGLRDGDIDMIVTDHSPCPPQMKQKSTGDFFAAWGGIGSLQLSLPVVWTEAKRRGFKEEDIARWMAAAPARLAGLSNQKGKIAPGYDADFVVWDPAEEFTVKPENLCHRHKLTPYASRRLCGVVKETYLRGQPISSACQPVGRILRHSHR